jgi:hypothetical protein
MRKITIASLTALTLMLTACSSPSPVYDASEWIDDSANGIAINMSSVEINDGMSSEAKELLLSYSKEVDGAKYAALSLSSEIGSMSFSQYGENSIVNPVDENPLLSLYKPSTYEAKCVDKKGSFYRLYKDYTYADILIELAESKAAYSFLAYNQIGLIYNISDHPNLKTQVVFVEYNMDKKLKEISVAYFDKKFDNSESFATFYNESLTSNEAIYAAASARADTYIMEELNDEDKNNIFVANIPTVAFNNSLYDVYFLEDGTSVLQELLVTESNCSLGKKYEIPVK